MCLGVAYKTGTGPKKSQSVQRGEDSTGDDLLFINETQKLSNDYFSGYCLEWSGFVTAMNLSFLDGWISAFISNLL